MFILTCKLLKSRFFIDLTNNIILSHDGFIIITDKLTNLFQSYSWIYIHLFWCGVFCWS